MVPTKPNVDVSFFNTRVYDVDIIDVIVGQSFTLKAQSDTQYSWFSNNDAVLSMQVTGNTAEVKADTVGDSIILLMDSNMQIVKQLFIKVVMAILPEADQLTLVPDPPIGKP